MANRNPAEQPQGIDTVSIPHSGQLEGPMQELPTRRFDKTLLEEAHEQNLITIPDSPPADPEMEQKSSKNKAVIGGIAAAAAITAGAAGFAMGNSGSESNDTPSDNQASTEVVQGSQADNILDTPPTETTITVESNETSDKDGELAEMEPWEEFEEIQRTLWEYNTLEVQEVTADRAEDYIRELNYLIAIALIDADQDRATQAISALTNDSPHAEQFVQFLEQYRENNLELSRTAGIKDTFVAEPGTIETLDTGDGYAIITSSNVTLRVRDNGSSYPQPADNTRGTTYYYVRIEDSGEKYLMGAFDTLADWDGQSAPMS